MQQENHEQEEGYGDGYDTPATLDEAAEPVTVEAEVVDLGDGGILPEEKHDGHGGASEEKHDGRGPESDKDLLASHLVHQEDETHAVQDIVPVDRVHKIVQPKSVSLGGLSFPFGTPEEAWDSCERLSKTSIIPKDFRGKPNSIFTVAMMGARLGIDPISSMNGICEINGRPCIWGGVLTGVCMAHHEFVDVKEWFDGEGDTLTAYCSVKRGNRNYLEESFSMAEAKQAGLLNCHPLKPWATYPRRMLKSRARGYAYKTVFSDILAGMSTVEEMQDVREVELREAESTVVDENKDLMNLTPITEEKES